MNIYYEDRIVCFLDILGFKEQVNETVQGTESENKKKTNILCEALVAIGDSSPIDEYGAEHTQKLVTQFSDSLVISFPIAERMGVFFALSDLLNIQIRLAYSGILCRGGVAQGKLIHRREPNLLLGPGLNQAYEPESKIAKSPRIILDEAIITADVTAHGLHHHKRHERKAIEDLITRDDDNFYYLDYITKAQGELSEPEFDYPEYIYLLRDIIASGLLNPAPCIQSKYLWMKKKFMPTSPN